MYYKYTIKLLNLITAINPHFTQKVTYFKTMVNPQVETTPNFPGECLRPIFNIDIVKEGWEEFEEIEIKKWLEKVLKYFGKGSEIQPRDIEKKDSSATNVGNDIDFLATNLWPLLGKSDLLNLLVVRKALG